MGPLRSTYSLERRTEPFYTGGAVVADAGPNMLSFMVDGRLCDGGPDIKTWPNVREGRMNE